MRKEGTHFEISVYNGELTDKCIADSSRKLMLSFPSLSGDFYDILTDRLLANSFCDQRLKKSVEHVIDTCIYPTPTIAQFISFDKLIKLYDYKQMLALLTEIGQKAFSKLYKAVKIGDNDRPMYAAINDINEFNLELWKK